ncbi:hypothetical protein MIR68_007961 [Amoeboaphelidium protococcarum]|nr:hypothetical protein MIR68_007961 [Amoeboaphelidium protococcarum]
MDDDFDEELLGLAAGSKSVNLAQKKSTKGKGVRKRKSIDGGDDDDDGAYGSDNYDSSNVHGSSEEDEDDLDGFSEDSFDRLSASDNDDDDEEEDFGVEDDALSPEEIERLTRSMTEIQRETFMAEQEEKRQLRLQKIELKKRLRAEAAASKGGVKARRTRSSTGQRQKTSGSSRRSSKLKELTERRKKRQKGEQTDLPDFGEYEDSDGDGDLGYGRGGGKDSYLKRARRAYDKSGLSDGSFGASAGGAGKERPVPTLSQINSIRMSRDQLEKWMFTPFFEDTVLGCFIRLGVGQRPEDGQPVYRLAQIVGVEEYHRNYKMNKTSTRTALRIRHGKAEKVFLMDIVSNSDVTQHEYDRWVAVMKSEKCRFQSEIEIQRLRDGIHEAVHHVFTDEEINYMIQEKKKIAGESQNLLAEKVRLVALRDEADSMGQSERVIELNVQIRQITEYLEDPDSSYLSFQAYTEMKRDQVIKPSPSKKDVWAQLNEKNRRKNMEEVSRAEEKLKKERYEKLMNGKGANDPFARIKSRSIMNVSPQPQIQNGTSADKQSLIDSSAKGAGAGVLSPTAHTVVDAAKANGNHSQIPAAASSFEEYLQEVDIDI